jgi:hypothetical protein
MGTPVKIRAREDQCVGAGPCSESRPMTEEEMLKYYTKEEIERMSKKLDAPAKEKLIEILAEKQGKTNSTVHAAETFKVSAPTVYGWIKEYGIEFDGEGKVIVENKALEPEVKEDVPSESLGNQKIILSDIVYPFAEADKPTITITGEETTKKHYKVGYAEYDIGNATLQVDFRQELVKIISPSDNEMTFEEAEAMVDLLNEIL